MIALALVLGMAAQAGAGVRHDIVFVLGEDVPGGRPFHAPALAWHRERRSDTRHLVEGLRSLQGVREWLASARRGDTPWGEITLVTHGSPWTGLDIALYEGGAEKASPSSLAQALSNGEFPALPDHVLDAHTRIVLDSCGLGRRSDVLQMIATLFGGDDAHAPRVSASRELVEYGVSDYGSWRREQPMRAQVFPPGIPEAQMRAELLAGEAEPATAMSMALKPIRVELTLPGAAAVSGRTLARLARRSDAAIEALRAHAIDPGNVRWRLLRPGEDVVLGEAVLAQLSPVFTVLPPQRPPATDRQTARAGP